MKNITIKDIAEKTGYSTATVSRVINNNPSVSKDSRIKIEAAIEDLGYYPNLIARNLKNNSTKTIALLVADGTNEYFIQIAKAIDNIVRAQGYTLFVFNTFNDKKREQSYLQMLVETKVEGIILNTCCQIDDFIVQLSKHLPIVLMHRRIADAKFRGDFIDADFGKSSYELTMKLIENGHEKIGLISGPLYYSSALERYKYFIKALNTINIEVDTNYKYLYEGPFTSEFGYQAAQNLLSHDDPPTAMMIMHCETTIGTLRYLRVNNINVPQDISLVSPCNINLADLFYVQPFHAIPNTWALGQRAGEMILERINCNNDIINREVVYTTTIKHGNSISSLI